MSPLTETQAVSPSPTAVRFDDAQMWVDLDDGRTMDIPLVWFPRRLHGTAEQRGEFFLSPDGIHWDGLDEDISIAGLLAGYGDRTQTRRTAA